MDEMFSRIYAESKGIYDSAGYILEDYRFFIRYLNKLIKKVEKLKKMAENIPYQNEETHTEFFSKLDDLKSYIDKIQESVDIYSSLTSYLLPEDLEEAELIISGDFMFSDSESEDENIVQPCTETPNIPGLDDLPY